MFDNILCSVMHVPNNEGIQFHVVRVEQSFMFVLFFCIQEFVKAEENFQTSEALAIIMTEESPHDPELRVRSMNSIWLKRCSTPTQLKWSNKLISLIGLISSFGTIFGTRQYPKVQKVIKHPFPKIHPHTFKE